METYWDLEERERATLTDDEVRRYCDIEIMQAGVVAPKEPELRDETVPDVPTTTVYELTGRGRYGAKHLSVVFPTAEAAEKALALGAAAIVEHYEAGDKGKYATLAEGYREVIVMSEADFTRHKSELERAKEAKSHNEKAREQFAKDCAAARDATAGIWEDFHRCVEKAAELDRVRETWAEYVDRCKGNESIARGFLVKAYGEEKVTEAIGPEVMTQEASA